MVLAREVSVSVDGGTELWGIYRADGADEPLVRDVDLAERAGKATPRTIRTAIRSMIAKGLLGVRSYAYNSEIAQVFEVAEIVPAGGGTKISTVYYLTRAAAIRVLARLRTPEALALQERVFEAMTRHGSTEAELSALRLEVAEMKRMLVGERQKCGALTAQGNSPVSRDPRKAFELRQTLMNLARESEKSFEYVHGTYRKTHRLVSYLDTPLVVFDANLARLREQLDEAKKDSILRGHERQRSNFDDMMEWASSMDPDAPADKKAN